MTLSIIDSMLRGDLRKQILATLKTEKEISLLWRGLMKAMQGEQNLLAIEQALFAAVEASGLVKVSSDYNDDREMRQGAEEARKHGMSFCEDDYTRVDEKICLDGVFAPVVVTTPTDKFLHLLVKVECRHIIESLLMLVQSVHDDAVVRTYIRKLFSAITSLCKDANDLYIKESLTQLYFEVYHTFRNVLEKGNLQSYETDFENFVFGWKGVFPEEEVMARYNEIIYMSSKAKTETPIIQPLKDEQKEVQVPTGSEAEENDVITKYDHFVEVVQPYKFFDCPAVVCLNMEQRGKLVRLIVNRRDNYGAYAVAMLCELNYDKWMMDNFAKANPYSKRGLTKTAIQNHWKDALSLTNLRAVAGNYNVIRNPNGKEDKTIYKASEYTKRVHDDYMAIIE